MKYSAERIERAILGRRHGMTAAEVFWARVNRSAGPGGCWMWVGYRNPMGYGMWHHDGQSLAHRVAFELTRGPIPAGLTLDHLCRVPACVNPAHLEPVTLGENVRRAVQPRSACPSGHPYDEANTYRDRKGSPICRACHRVNELARKRRLGVSPRQWAPGELARLIAPLLDAGLSQHEVARRLGVNSSTVCRTAQRMAA